MRRTAIAITLAAMLALAGCAGTMNGATPTQNGGTDSTTVDDGRVNFYLSDEPNAIDDFEHLNVTVTAVGFAKADTDAEESDDAETDDAGSDDAETDDVEGDTDDAENDTAETDDVENETTTTTATTTGPAENETETSTVDEDDADAGEVADKNESDDWVVRQVDNETVDLTELKGANATMLTDFAVPNGTYETAFVYVSDVNATLANGEQVNVKLPSEKLHVNKQFTVGANESVDFVFDITVHKAGNAGKYVLKPVVAESGVDVPIVDVDDRDDEDETALRAAFVGNVTAGENATVEVTREGSAVANATVTVNDEVVGETNAEGTLSFAVPENATDVEVEVEDEGDDEAELERTLGAADDDDDAPAELAAAFITNVTASGDATIQVTDADGDAVEDATVTVDGEVVGETDADGTLSFVVPEDVEALDVVVTKGDAEAELEHDVAIAATA